MSKRKEQSLPAAESLSYEQAVAELEAIIERIEGGEIGLEESLAQFQRGEMLLKRCRGVLTIAEQQVRELDMSNPGSESAGQVDDDEYGRESAPS